MWKEENVVCSKILLACICPEGTKRHEISIRTVGLQDQIRSRDIPNTRLMLTNRPLCVVRKEDAKKANNQTKKVKFFLFMQCRQTGQVAVQLHSVLTTETDRSGQHQAPAALPLKKELLVALK